MRACVANDLTLKLKSFFWHFVFYNLAQKPCRGTMLGLSLVSRLSMPNMLAATGYSACSLWMWSLVDLAKNGEVINSWASRQVVALR